MKINTQHSNLIGFFLLILLSACSYPSSTHVIEEKEDLTAKLKLQGLWLDDATESPIFHIQGDTLYYSDSSIAPVAFKIIKDSLKTYGSQPTSYYIQSQSTYSLSIQSLMGDILQLRKAETYLDSVNIIPIDQPIINHQKEVIQKDRIVYYNNVRYRGYVYINPSQIKVIYPTISDEGFEVDNIFYDNIIHICVYKGEEKLFGKDIYKQDFTHIIPDSFLQRGILTDMNFIQVDAKGYHYQATICTPDGVSCYYANLYISFQNEITYELVRE